MQRRKRKDATRARAHTRVLAFTVVTSTDISVAHTHQLLRPILIPLGPWAFKLPCFRVAENCTPKGLTNNRLHVGQSVLK